MKSRLGWFYTFFATLAATLILPCAFAQQGSGPGMGQGKGRGMGMYDPSSVVTVKGTVEDVQQGMMQQGHMGNQSGMGGMGTHLLVKTDKETLTVMLGPSSFLNEKNFSVAKGDKVEVTGSKVKFGNSDAIIAREVKDGGKTLTLRNEQGVPEWSMGPKR